MKVGKWMMDNIMITMYPPPPKKKQASSIVFTTLEKKKKINKKVCMCIKWLSKF